MDALDEIRKEREEVEDAVAGAPFSAEDDIHRLNKTAVETLRTVLEGADSDDVKRKAAVDILNFSSVGKSKGRAPVVTEAQLEFLGRVIVEAGTVREGLEISKGPVVEAAHPSAE